MQKREIESKYLKLKRLFLKLFERIIMQISHHMSSLSFSTNEVIVSRARELSRKLKRKTAQLLYILLTSNHDFECNFEINEHS